MKKLKIITGNKIEEIELSDLIANLYFSLTSNPKISWHEYSRIVECAVDHLMWSLHPEEPKKTQDS